MMSAIRIDKTIEEWWKINCAPAFVREKPSRRLGLHFRKVCDEATAFSCFGSHRRPVLRCKTLFATTSDRPLHQIPFLYPSFAYRKATGRL
jgi:hypothetical protein